MAHLPFPILVAHFQVASSMPKRNSNPISLPKLVFLPSFPHERVTVGVQKQKKERVFHDSVRTVMKGSSNAFLFRRTQSFTFPCSKSFYGQVSSNIFLPLACKGYVTIIRSKKPAISSSQIISVSTLEHSYFMAHPLDRRG